MVALRWTTLELLRRFATSNVAYSELAALGKHLLS
jgi:hypothetical protein